MFKNDIYYDVLLNSRCGFAQACKCQGAEHLATSLQDIFSMQRRFMEPVGRCILVLNKSPSCSLR